MFSSTVHDQRYYDNPFPDFDPQQENQLIDMETKKIHPTFLEKLKSVVDKLMDTLEQNIQSMRRDGTVYTGMAGISVLYFMMSEKLQNPIYLEKAANLIESSLAKIRNKGPSFLCGDGGPLAIGAVIFHKQNNSEKSQKCISQLLNFMPYVLNEESDVPDELLYGRAGYLYCLLFVNKYIPGSINDGYLKQVINAIFASGQNMALEMKTKASLMFEWHSKKYLGGAHGVSGILYELFQSKPCISPEQLNFIKPTVDYLLTVRYSSGNFPSSLGSDTDRLVHWCHGAPGMVQMLCEAYEEFKDRRYLDAAELCGDVVWERGLLRKGYGICHGVAGNAYTFLILYQLTKDIKYLHRACKFAEWCTTYNQHQDRSPDRPYSLFEGLAGTIYFLIDVQEPLEAKFPCFTL